MFLAETKQAECLFLNLNSRACPIIQKGNSDTHYFILISFEIYVNFLKQHFIQKIKPREMLLSASFQRKVNVSNTLCGFEKEVTSENSHCQNFVEQKENRSI